MLCLHIFSGSEQVNHKHVKDICIANLWKILWATIVAPFQLHPCLLYISLCCVFCSCQQCRQACQRHLYSQSLKKSCEPLLLLHFSCIHVYTWSSCCLFCSCQHAGRHWQNRILLWAVYPFCPRQVCVDHTANDRYSIIHSAFILIWISCTQVKFLFDIFRSKIFRSKWLTFVERLYKREIET